MGPAALWRVPSRPQPTIRSDIMPVGEERFWLEPSITLPARASHDLLVGQAGTRWRCQAIPAISKSSHIRPDFSGVSGIKRQTDRRL
jgi:hypothetical protein